MNHLSIAIVVALTISASPTPVSHSPEPVSSNVGGEEATILPTELQIAPGIHPLTEPNG